MKQDMALWGYRDGLPWLLNPHENKTVAATSRRAKGTALKEKNNMANKRKKRKLAGAALAAHLRKKSGSKRRARRVVAVAVAKVGKARRKRHMVKAHPRAGGPVRGYRRGPAHVSAHMSNPYHRRRARRNPAFGLGQMGGTIIEGVVLFAAFAGALVAVGFVSKQLEKLPMAERPWVSVGYKVTLALGAAYAADRFLRGNLSKFKSPVLLAAFSPAFLGALKQFMPALAGNITLAQDEGDLSMGPGNRITDYKLGAELSAELSAELNQDERQERETESAY